MRFVVDECVGPKVAAWLREEGHDVLSIYDEARGLPDDEVLELAVGEQRILVTADKGFGEKVHRFLRTHCGVILLRLQDERFPSKIRALKRVIDRYGDELSESFVVITDATMRLAR